MENNIDIHRIDLGVHKSGFIDQSKLFVKFMIKVLGLVKRKERYDTIYVTSSRLMTVFLGALISNRQKAKLYLDIRDIFTDTIASMFVKRKLRYVVPLFRQIERYTINSADHINLVSKGFESHFKQINNKVDYSFYTNGIDDVFLNYDFSAAKQNDKTIITYAGNIGEGQGLEKIVPDIARKIGTDYEIHIIGDGGRKKMLIERLKDLDNVKLFDPVNRDRLLEIYKNSDILFLHLNNYEAFEKVLPSKVFEYAATNKFIIAGVGGYAKKFIEQNISGAMVFEPCNIEDFYSKFQNIDKIDDICRNDFIESFKRNDIMKSLAEEIYEL